MKKKISVICGIAMMIGILTACQNMEPGVTVAENENASENSSEQSFGLKDFDGFYYQTSSEEMDGYTVTYTYGYQLNADGTGTYYGQDICDITWNETEIHVGDKVYNYDMEPGKLTVNADPDCVYDKCSGNFIKPNPCTIDPKHLGNGIYPAKFAAEDIIESDGKYSVSATIFSEDTYDIVDIGRMSAGDIIFIDGELLEVNDVNTLDTGLKEINGGIDEGGASLRNPEDTNGYVYAGYDDITSYTELGVVNLSCSTDFKLIDNSDPTESKEYIGAEAADGLKTLADNYSISEYNCRVLVEDGVVTQITRMYTP